MTIPGLIQRGCLFRSAEYAALPRQNCQLGPRGYDEKVVVPYPEALISAYL